MNVNDVVTNIRLPKKLHEELKKEASRKNISFASLVRLVCSEYLEKTKSKNEAACEES